MFRGPTETSQIPVYVISKNFTHPIPIEIEKKARFLSSHNFFSIGAFLTFPFKNTYFYNQKKKKTSKCYIFVRLLISQ